MITQKRLCSGGSVYLADGEESLSQLSDHKTDFNKHVNMGPTGIRPPNDIRYHRKAVFCMSGTYIGTYPKCIHLYTCNKR